MVRTADLDHSFFLGDISNKCSKIGNQMLFAAVWSC